MVSLPAPRPAARRRRLPFGPWHLLLMPLSLLFVLPLAQMVLTSFMSDSDINRFPPRFIPTHLHLSGYAGLFTQSHILQWLVNTVVVFIGPEYLFDGKQITRAGLEDHCCGKLLGVPMGVDVCYTNHAEADQDDMDNLLTLLAAAGVTFIMGVPGADDVMLNYQSTSFHDALYVRDLFGLKRAPEFDDWLVRAGLADSAFRLAGNAGLLPDFASRLIGEGAGNVEP